MLEKNVKSTALSFLIRKILHDGCSYSVENGARMKAIVDIPSRHSLTEPDLWVFKHMFLQQVESESKIHLLGLEVVRVDQVEIYIFDEDSLTSFL
jgi:hypothetical protein